MSYRLTPTGWLVVGIIILILITVPLAIRHHQLIYDLTP